jgi:hypothetical protein
MEIYTNLNNHSNLLQVMTSAHIITSFDVEKIWSKYANSREQAVICAQCRLRVVFWDDLQIYENTIHPLFDVIPRCINCIAQHMPTESEKVVYVASITGANAYTQSYDLLGPFIPQIAPVIIPYQQEMIQQPPMQIHYPIVVPPPMQIHHPKPGRLAPIIVPPRCDSEKLLVKNLGKRHRKVIPPDTKLEMWDRYIGDKMHTMCFCCQRLPITFAHCECGHVVSVANGGDDRVSNLRPICSTCNKSMGTQNLFDYQKMILALRK